MSEATDYKIFEHGVVLFNRQAFFEAHEIWEQLWKEARGPRRILLQGLIQTAAALLHVQRGNRRGAALLAAKAIAKLAVQDEGWGLDLETLCREIKDYFARIAADDHPDDPPAIRFDAAGRPVPD
jgi:uncharacterized protein